MEWIRIGALDAVTKVALSVEHATTVTELRGPPSFLMQRPIAQLLEVVACAHQVVLLHHR